MSPNSRSVVITHQREQARTRCNSGVDGTVRTEEGYRHIYSPESHMAVGVFVLIMKNRKQIKWLSALLTAAIFLIGWQALVWIFNLPAFILPSPAQVGARFLKALSDGSLSRHIGTTMLEILSGLAGGVLLAVVLGYFLAKSRFLETVLQPFLVASQAVPIVAIAPLMVIWFGPGIFSKILICALIVFFSCAGQYCGGAA